MSPQNKKDNKDFTSTNERLIEHSYDGIQEYDNPMPRWWLLTFAGTVILVTHDQDVARHAKRILVLRDGEIVADTPDHATAIRALRSSIDGESP